MSEPRHPSEKHELETVVNWRMIATGAALGAGAGCRNRLPRTGACAE